MRAVLLATGEVPDGNSLGARHLLPMLPLLDRPFVQHVLEYFAGQGVQEFDVVLSHLPERIESCLGDGARWGCRVTYHLARNPARPCAVLSRLGLDPRSGERLLLGRADRLPIVQLPSAAGWEDASPAVLFMSPDRQRQSHRGTALLRRPDGSGEPSHGGLPGAADEWTGWGLLTARDLLAIPPDMPAARLYAHLRSAAAREVLLWEVTTVLGVRTPREMLAAQRAVLDKPIGGLMFRGRERAPGVWVAGSAKVSPTAELVAPVFIGPHCTVGSAAQVGPHAVVAAGCLLDRHCRISNSSVLAGSYVGEGMVLDGAVVDKDLAVNARTNTAKLFSDPLTLGRVPNVSLTRIVLFALPRLFALAVLIAAAPLLLLTILGLALLRRGRVFHSRVVVRLPLSRADGQWPTYRLCSFAAAREGINPARRPSLRHLLLEVLPGLIHIVRGELHFVGVSPRSPEEVNSLPPEWRTLYLHTKAGLVSATTLLGPAPRVEDQCAADAAYAASRSWRQDVRMLAAYLWQVCRESLGQLLLPPASRSAKEDVAGPSLPRRPETLRNRPDGAGPQGVPLGSTAVLLYPIDASPKEGLAVAADQPAAQPPLV